MDLKRILANNIFILRNEHGLTQQEFADKLGMSRGHISHIENGDNMPSAEFIKSVCTTFLVSSDWLLNCNINLPKKEHLNDEDIILALKYHHLPDRLKASIKNLIDNLSK